MAITNPTKYVTVRRLERFEGKLGEKYATQDGQDAAVLELNTRITNVTTIPVDIDNLTPSSSFVKNSVLGIDGVMYRAKKDTTEFPVVVLVEDGHIVYDEDENGNKAFVVEDYTLSQDWEIWSDAAIPRALQRMSAQQNTFVEQQTAQQSSFITQQTAVLQHEHEVMADFRTEVRLDVAGVIKASEEITASSGQKYTVRQILQAMAELMDKTVVVDTEENSLT